MPETGIPLNVISVDREILLMILPFEIKIGIERIRSTLEYRNDGFIKFLWQTNSKVVLNEEELQNLASILLQEYESQSVAEIRNSIKQELVNKILDLED